jgi:hypothetical protein
MVDHQSGMLAQLVPTDALQEPGKTHHDWATPFLSAACAPRLPIPYSWIVSGKVTLL